MAATSTSSTTATRLLWVDNLRILLTILVILLHLSIAYGAPGDWYYNEEGSVSKASEVLLTLFVAINQAFFMGLFFLISSYFSLDSLDRKGRRPYLTDRFVRLGIPMLFYALVLNPVLVAVLVAREEAARSFLDVVGARYTEMIGVGPTWFLEALLFFSVALALWRTLMPSALAHSQRSAPNAQAIGLFALGLGLVSFGVRVWLPVGWWLEPFHFQLAHFPQYVALFVVGVVAQRWGWLGAITDAQGHLAVRLAAALIILFPVLLVSGGGLEGDVDVFLGGAHWQQMAFAVWEQLTCMSIVVALLVTYRNRFDHQGRLVRKMSGAAYATYVLHAPVITLLALALSGVSIEMGVKAVVVAPVAVALSFLAGYVVKRLPVARDIL